MNEEELIKAFLTEVDLIVEHEKNEELAIARVYTLIRLAMACPLIVRARLVNSPSFTKFIERVGFMSDKVLWPAERKCHSCLEGLDCPRDPPCE